MVDGDKCPQTPASSKDVKGAGDNMTDVDDDSVSDFNDDEKMQFFVDYLKLPTAVKRRVKALKNVLYDYIKVETEFYTEIFNIEKKYMERYEAFVNKRSAIVSGEIEPTDEESSWNFCQEDDLAEDLTKQHIESRGDAGTEDLSDCKGIPRFWLKVLLHASPTSDLIKEKDHAVLEHLVDIRVELNSDESEMGFSLNFHFSPNEYFNETVLSKHYYFDNKPPAENPLMYDGPQIVRVKSSPITWKPGKNITVKFMKKVKKHKNRKEVRTITKTVKQDSFFNFFDPQSESLTDEDIDEDTAELLQEDFRIASYMRDIMIPRAVLFFTGEGVESDDGYNVDDDDDDDDDDIDDNEDEMHHQKNYRDKGKRGCSGKTSEEKSECQQS